jgi:hypothetical protein
LEFPKEIPMAVRPLSVVPLVVASSALILYLRREDIDGGYGPVNNVVVEVAKGCPTFIGF